MGSVVTWAVTAIISFIAYFQLYALFQIVVLKAPPVAANSWLEFLTGKSLPGYQLIVKNYQEYSKRNEVFRAGEHYVLPPSVFASVRKTPDRIVHSTPANEDSLILDPFLGHDNTDIISLVRSDLTKAINSMIPALVSEVHTTLDLNFSPSTTQPVVIDNETWFPIVVHPAALASIGRIVTRVLVGAKYAENPVWTRTLSGFANGIIFQSFLLKHLPIWLTRIIAPLFNTTRRVAKLRDLIRPDVRNLIAHPLPSSEVADGEVTVLPMIVNYVLSRPAYASASESQILAGIIGRLLDMSFGAIDTTSITTTQVLLDLISSPPSTYAIPIISQARATLTRHNGDWSVKALGELTLLDSFIKESQRLRPIGSVLSNRKVLDPAGATFTPSPEFADAKPVHVPYGKITGMPLFGIHRDPNVYPDPDEFKGFRFAEDAVPSSQPTDKFLSFGHGKHACPGRHLALVVVKLIVIEFLETYEYKLIERPKDWSFGFAVIPNMRAPVYIRRKEGL